MKRIVVLVLLVAIISPVVFADDALVLPARVIRFRTIPSYSFFSQAYDNDGEKQDLGGGAVDRIGIWGLNFALEVGVTEQINVAAQWTPGWQFASAVTAGDTIVDPDLAAAVGAGLLTQAQALSTQQEAIENQQYTGLNDLFLGAKIQILGDSGYVPSDTMRFAVSLGVKAPLSMYDPDSAAEDAAAGNEYQVGRVDRDVWGVGARLHYDYIFSEMFYLNLYSQTQIFLPRDLDVGGGTEVEYKYGYAQTFEIDPSFSYTLSDAVSLSANLATAYSFTPDIEVGGSTVDDSATQLLTITPQVGAFFMGLPVPIETKLRYGLPIYGVNSPATNTIAMQINAYLRF